MELKIGQVRCISHFEKYIHIKQVYLYWEIKLLQQSFYFYFHVLIPKRTLLSWK